MPRPLMLEIKHNMYYLQAKVFGFRAPALAPTHVSLRTSASSSTKMVCVAVR